MIAFVSILSQLKPDSFVPVGTECGTVRRALLPGCQVLGFFASFDWYKVDILTGMNGLWNRRVLGRIEYVCLID